MIEYLDINRRNQQKGILRQKGILTLPKSRSLLFDLYPPEVGFSLRRLDANYTGDILEVRRSSDNTTLGIGFNGVDLDTAALEAFCNPNTVIYTSDFTAGNEDLFVINGLGSDGETVAGVSDCYKFELTNGSNIHQASKGGFDNNQSMTVTFDYYIPSTNVELNALFVGFVSGTTELQPSITDTWTSVTLQITDSNNGLFFFRGWSNSGQVFSADGDVFYLKNIVITQLTSDAFVTTWYDQSRNGNDATQTTAASQPKIASSGSVILENGKPAISFDGVDDCFETTNNLTNYTNPAFLVFIGQVDTFPSAILGKLSGGNRGLGFTIDDKRYRIYREGYGTNDHATTTPTSQILVDFQMINGVSNLYENTIGIDNPQNTLQGLDFDGTTNAIGVNLALGYYDGKMQSIVLYHSDQSGNRSGIETALNDYYNIY